MVILWPYTTRPLEYSKEKNQRFIKGKKRKWSRRNQESGKKSRSGQERSPRRRERDSKHFPLRRSRQNRGRLTQSPSKSRLSITSRQCHVTGRGHNGGHGRKRLLFTTAETALNRRGLCQPRPKGALRQSMGWDSPRGYRHRTLQQKNHRGEHSLNASHKYVVGSRCVLRPGDTACPVCCPVRDIREGQAANNK